MFYFLQPLVDHLQPDLLLFTTNSWSCTTKSFTVFIQWMIISNHWMVSLLFYNQWWIIYNHWLILLLFTTNGGWLTSIGWLFYFLQWLVIYIHWWVVFTFFTFSNDQSNILKSVSSKFMKKFFFVFVPCSAEF